MIFGNDVVSIHSCVQGEVQFTREAGENTEMAQRKTISNSEFEISNLSMPPLRSLSGLCGELNLPNFGGGIKSEGGGRTLENLAQVNVKASLSESNRIWLKRL